MQTLLSLECIEFFVKYSLVISMSLVSVPNILDQVEVTVRIHCYCMLTAGGCEHTPQYPVLDHVPANSLSVWG